MCMYCQPDFNNFRRVYRGTHAHDSWEYIPQKYYQHSEGIFSTFRAYPRQSPPEFWLGYDKFSLTEAKLSGTRYCSTFRAYPP